MYRKLLPLVLALFLAACQGGPLIRIGPTPTPFPEEYTGKAQVNGHELNISCRGSGEPTIILERGPWQDKGFDLFDKTRFGEITRTCFYLRLGQDTGDVFTEPRTVMDQVKDLHELLAQTGVPGPYILAGYAQAGYNLVLYTDQYPQDVAGLVFIEPWYPTFYNIHLDVLGPVTAENSVEKNGLIIEKQDYLAHKVYLWKDHPEYVDQLTSEADVLKVASLKDVPLTIVQSEVYFLQYSDPELDQGTTKAVNESQKDFCKLSSKCQTIMVPGTNLLTVVYNKAVDKAIQEMVDAVKKD